jgi:hypothetical protein
MRSFALPVALLFVTCAAFAQPTPSAAPGASAPLSPAPSSGEPAPATSAGSSPSTTSTAPSAAGAPDALPSPPSSPPPSATEPPPAAAAPPAEAERPAAQQEDTQVRGVSGLPAFRLEDTPGWSGSLGVNGALLALLGSDIRGAYSVGGAALRLRYQYYTLGGTFELSDSASGTSHFRAIGGFAGAFLPFRNWVDVELAARLSLRTYEDRADRFGPAGYTHDTMSLGLSAMFSDRAGSGLFGTRLGGGLALGYDLDQREYAWRAETTDGRGTVVDVHTGVDRVGGFSTSLFLEVALDISE